MSNINYENAFVAGVCLLPTYLSGALILNRLTPAYWLIGMLPVLLVANFIYQWGVLLPIKLKLTRRNRYLLTLVTQLAIVSVFILTVNQWGRSH